MTRDNEMIMLNGIEILSCSCCGAGVRNTVEDNVCFGQVPYPQDLGFAQCRSCFGEAESPQLQLQEHDSKPTRRWKTRKKLGWAGQAFFDTRIQLLKMKLSDKNAERFASMTYDRQCTIVGKMIEKGLLT